MPKYTYAVTPMRIQARKNSKAEQRYYSTSGLPGMAMVKPAAIAPGISPSVQDDLIYHGGKVVPQMEFQNIYLGGDTVWKEQDIVSIDTAIDLAMREPRLNNVMAQYFPGAKMVCEMRESFILQEAAPKSIDEDGVQAKITELFDQALIKDRDLPTTLFNLILPPGMVLRLGSSTSKEGLGGYHGSVHVRRGGKKVTLYYSANVYSQTVAGVENGIDVLNRPWKNVVGTLYHEINEFRTDADVNDAIEKNDTSFLGWNSRRGHECGDQPIFEANPLTQVFKEVRSTLSKRRIPVQFMFSNAVHGAEGPIIVPHNQLAALKKR
ncbi:MAG: hypothetical protein ACRCV9_10520 [Burkholderiaceae bacterium]